MICHLESPAIIFHIGAFLAFSMLAPYSALVSEHIDSI